MRLAVGCLGLATTAATLAACSASGPASAGSIRYLDRPFTHPMRFGSIAIQPPAIGEQPIVPVTQASYVAQHPASWLTGASRADLVAFGYGRVSAPTSTLDDQPSFDHGRLAWVAVYRASAAHLVFNGCLDGPGGRTGYHFVPAAPKPDPFYIAVLVDATTGVQATSSPTFHDTCAHLAAIGDSRTAAAHGGLGCSGQWRPASGPARAQPACPQEPATDLNSAP
jgi:hypothetical protein